VRATRVGRSHTDSAPSPPRRPGPRAPAGSRAASRARRRRRPASPGARRPRARGVGSLGEPVDDGVEDEAAPGGAAGADRERPVEGVEQAGEPDEDPGGDSHGRRRGGDDGGRRDEQPEPVAASGGSPATGGPGVGAVSQPRTSGLSVGRAAVPARPGGQVLVPAQHCASPALTRAVHQAERARRHRGSALCRRRPRSRLGPPP
jgi:hypothetical protein